MYVCTSFKEFDQKRQTASHGLKDPPPVPVERNAVWTGPKKEIRQPAVIETTLDLYHHYGVDEAVEVYLGNHPVLNMENSTDLVSSVSLS